MCHATTEGGLDTRRELHHAGGRIVQCLGCGSIGVELGTTYLVFSEKEFFRFARWFGTLTWEEAHVVKDKLRIGIQEESSLMLSLTRSELQSATSLFAEGMRWITESGHGAEPESNCEAWPASATVH